jgi:tetratricopeptide (TPR) repeat protein
MANTTPVSLNDAERRRLDRLMRWCTDGRLAAAELELHEWSRQRDCPRAARVMLASLMCRRGKTEDARAILRQCEAAAADPDAAMLRIATLIGDELTDAARREARELHDAHGDRGDVARWLRAISVPGSEHLPPVALATVDQLAEELIEQPELIPSLVYAMKLQPKTREATLLRQAIARAARAFDGQRRMVTICTAMAELALLLGDDDDARRWAHRGLKLEPYHAPLALVLSKVPDDPALGEPARDVLARVSSKRPTWPDIKAALIRREAADGDAGRARMRIEHWLNTEPDSPIAHDLAQELAA